VHPLLDGQYVAVLLTQVFESQTPLTHSVALQGVEHEPQANGFERVSRHSPKFSQYTVPAGHAGFAPTQEPLTQLVLDGHVL
jgi:hypothetical protein